MANEEQVCPVGYINDEMRHVLISVKNPSLTSEWGRRDFMQIAITIENAIILRAELNAFLKQHGIQEN